MRLQAAGVVCGGGVKFSGGQLSRGCHSWVCASGGFSAVCISGVLLFGLVTCSVLGVTRRMGWCGPLLQQVHLAQLLPLLGLRLWHGRLLLLCLRLWHGRMRLLLDMVLDMVLPLRLGWRLGI